MPLDSLTSFSRALLRIYALAQSQAVNDFQNAALEVVQEVLPFDSAMWGSATMSAQGIDIHTLHLYRTSMQMIHAYEKVKHLDHFAKEVTSKNTNTICFSATNAHGAAFRDFLVEYKHHHGLITQSINPQTQFAQWLSLFRNNPAHTPTDDEVKLLDSLYPHLRQSLAINRKLHLEQLLGNEQREKWSVAISDFRGIFYHADPEFLLNLRSDYIIDDPSRLPLEVVNAFTQSIFNLTSKHTVLLGSIENDLIFLKIRKKVAADNLSQKEFAIAKLLASGLSLKEIAKSLDRSPDTIRTHGKGIYQKLGTKKATQLSKLLTERE